MNQRQSDRRIRDRRQTQLVSDWKQFHKWWSIRIMAFLALGTEAYNSFPMLQDYLPNHIYRHVMFGLIIIAIVARLANQPKKGDQND